MLRDSTATAAAAYSDDEDDEDQDFGANVNSRARTDNGSYSNSKPIYYNARLLHELMGTIASFDEFKSCLYCAIAGKNTTNFTHYMIEALRLHGVKSADARHYSKMA